MPWCCPSGRGLHEFAWRSTLQLANAVVLATWSASVARAAAPEHPDHGTNFSGWIYPAIAVVVLAVCCLCCCSQSLLNLCKRDDPKAKGYKPTAVFRKNLNNDSYGYFEVMDRPEGAYEADSMLPSDISRRMDGQNVVVVLEKAALLLALELETDPKQVEIENELLVTHECLIALLDSPLNKTGKLTIFLHSSEDVLIEVHPSLRVPRTFPRFVRIIGDLIRKGEVSGQQANYPLMKIVPTPVEQYFPKGTPCYGLSAAGRQIRLRDVAEKVVPPEPEVIVFAIGASYQDPIQEKEFGKSYAPDLISICPWGLRASSACHMVCREFESLWEIVSPE